MKTILVLKANPKTTKSLALAREVREIREALKLSANRQQFFLENRGAVRVKDLLITLLEIEPQIVHFCGHGAGESGLVFETDDGEEQTVDADALANLFKLFNHHIECVLLNACHSEVQAKAIVEHINYVIGMEQDVLDEAAIAFAHGFYTALGAGKDIEQAFDFGQNAIQLEMSDTIQHFVKQRKFIHHISPEEVKEARIALHLIPIKHKKTIMNPIQDTSPPPSFYSSHICVDSFVGHSDWVRSLAFSSDSKLLISSSNDKTVRVWDVETKQLKHLLIGHNKRVKAIGISPDGQHIISGAVNSKIKLWETTKLSEKQTSECYKTLSISSTELTLVNSLPISPDSKLFATGNGNGKIKLWDVKTGKWKDTFQGHSSSVFALVFSGDGQTLVSGSYEKNIKIWGINGDFTQLRHLISYAHLSSILSLAISPDNQILVSAGQDSTIKRWNMATGTKTDSHHILKGHAGTVWCVAISPDGHKIASASADYTIKIWDLHTGKLLETLTDHVGEVRTVAFSPDGKWLASAGDDLEIKLWQMYEDT